MRDPREWDEDYLLSLPLGEFDWLEIKGRRAIDLTLPNVKETDCLLNLSKALSAFANSGGGILVFGLKNPSMDAVSWEVDDGGIPLIIKGNTSTREWLEDIIPNLLDDALIGANVYVIQRQLENSKIINGRGLFVIEIPDSERAPHQATNNRYYARVGGKSSPIGHRLVTDIFNRRQHPKMEIQAKFHIIRFRRKSLNELLGEFPALPVIENHQKEVEIDTMMTANFTVKNIGRVLVNFMHCTVWLPKGMLQPYVLGNKQKVEFVEGTEYVVWNANNIERDVVKESVNPLLGQTEYGPSWYKRILPSMTYQWDWGLLRPETLEAYADDYIRWEIIVDDAPIERGKIRIGDIQRTEEDKTRRINRR